VEVFSELQFRIRLHSESPNPLSGLALLFFNAYQERVAIVDLRNTDLFKVSKIKSEIEVSLKIDSMPLIEGDYNVGLYVESNLCVGNFLDIMRITVRQPKDMDVEPYPVQVRGVVEMKNSFKIV
jgi:hypothetical protein